MRVSFLKRNFQLLKNIFKEIIEHYYVSFVFKKTINPKYRIAAIEHDWN